MDKAELLRFKINGDDRGSLVALEGDKTIDYPIARIFYMFGMDRAAVRGSHANRKTTICFIAVKGRCTITVDDGSRRETFSLDAPNTGLVCRPMTWKEIGGFSPDCVLLGVCDTRYETGDYITDYESFLKEAKL
jgi:hypothetical protein